jgi:hypothetical protein
VLEATTQGGAASSIGLQGCSLSAAAALAVCGLAAEISGAFAELILTPRA